MTVEFVDRRIGDNGKQVFGGNMSDSVSRRHFMGLTAAATAAVSLGGTTGAEELKPVRVGVVGTGGRGTSLLCTMLGIGGVEFPALCDIREANLRRAQQLVVDAGRPKPEGYSDSETHYEALMERDDLDAVIIATPWQWHTPMSVCGMKNGKYVGVEVPCATTLEECWQLVDTQEETGVPCMMLENWSFRRDNLAVLRMIREGLLGDMVHAQCAYAHDCVGHWVWNPDGTPRWPAEFLAKYNRDQYPTHGLGPVLSWLDINCGDAFDYATAVSTAQRGINAYFERKFGPDHPNAKRDFAQGDIVTTVIKTHKGKSIIVMYDLQLPRPYDNMWLVQGTLGIYSHERESVYLEGRSPKSHQWEPFGPYQDEFDHPWWKDIDAVGGHGGTDTLELKLFLDAVRNGAAPPLDIYDSVTMSCVVGVSDESIKQGGAPVKCPDFTRGKWKTRKPTFGIMA